MWLLAAEVAAVLVLAAGVACIYPPAALILLGLLGVVACERASTAPKASKRAPERAREAS